MGKRKEFIVSRNKSLMKKIVIHLNHNQGVYNFVLSIIIGIIALTSFIISLNHEKSPHLQLYLYGEKINVSQPYSDFSSTVYIYNSRDAPCFGAVSKIKICI